MKAIVFRIIKLWVLVVLLGLSQESGAQGPFQRTFGSVGGNRANGLQVLSDGGYAITGWYDVTNLFTAEFYFIRTDSLGDSLWTRTYGEKVDPLAKVAVNGSGNEGLDALETMDGGFLLTGEVHGFGAGNSDVYIVRIDSVGDTLWSRTFGGLGKDYGEAAAQTNDSSFVIAGFTESFGRGIRDIYLIKLNEDGDTIWTRTIGDTLLDAATEIIPTKDGGFILCGQTFSYGAGLSDVLLLKVDRDGFYEWGKAYGGTQNDFGYSFAQCPDGGYVIVGATQSFGAGLEDVYLIKVDSLGDLKWSKTYGGVNFEGGHHIEVLDSGYVLTGYCMSFGAGREDVYAMKLDFDGDTLWTKTYGGPSRDAGNVIKQVGSDEFIIAGFTESFGAGFSDVYLIRTNGQGESGCHEYSTSTKVMSASTQESNVTFTNGSGAEVSSPKTLIGKTRTSVLNPCDVTIGETELIEPEILLYPNPAHSKISIEGFSGLGTITIYDLGFRRVIEENLDESPVDIGLEKLSGGTYLYVIHVGGIEHRGKLIVAP